MFGKSPSCSPNQKMLLNLTISILQSEQIQISDDALVIAEGTITTPAEHNGLMELILNEGLRSALTGQHFYDRYKTTDSAADLENCIVFCEKAVEHIPRSNPDPDVLCSRLTLLGGAYGLRYQRTGSTRDLERAIELTKDAINFTADTPLVSDYLEYLAASYSGLEQWLSQRFIRFGAMEDLHDAVDAAEMAVNLTLPDSSDWPGRMNDFGLRLSERSAHEGSKEDLDWAIKCLEMAVDAGASSGSDPQVIELTNLGMLLSSRFKLSGALEDLDRSVDFIEKALKRSPPEHSLRSVAMNNLAITLAERFEHHGTGQDLDRAIELQRAAVDATPEGHPDGVDRISNLGIWLMKRAQKTGSIEDINRSIDAIRAAIKVIPKDHKARPRLLLGLGSSLHLLYGRTSSVIDLEDAIEATKEAVSSVSPRDDIYAGGLNNLAGMLGERAQCYPRSSEIQNGPEAHSSSLFAEAIAVGRLSVDRTEIGHTDRPGRLSNLGDLLGQRFLRNGSENVDDINNAIEVTKQAVDTSPRASHQRAIILNNLGIWLLARHSQAGVAKDEIDALDCFKEGWGSQNATPFVRVHLARRAAEILVRMSRWKEAAQLLEEAINLLPTVAPRSLQHTDKQDMLAKFTGLASMAAAVALNAGKSAYDALKLLELGRGVIASLLLDMRGSISDLKTQHPSLATAFLSLRDELDSPPNSQALGNTPRDVSIWELQERKRRETERKFSELIGEIQSHTGFRHFCGTLDEDELKAAAVSGPIAVINVSRHRCDAFLIQPDSIRVLELPDLTMEEVQQRLRTLRQSPAGHPFDMRSLLEWLWTSITRPCLDALNFTSPISRETLAGWPRVWWNSDRSAQSVPASCSGPTSTRRRRDGPRSGHVVLCAVTEDFDPRTSLSRPGRTTRRFFEQSRPPACHADHSRPGERR